jgi:hypothetical protein
MACRGVLFAIIEAEAQKLKSARGNDTEVLSIVQDEIEADWDEAHLCQTDKAWDAIHRCLGDGTLQNGEGPLSLCILGGEQLHNDSSYIVSLLAPEQVKSLKPCARWRKTGFAFAISKSIQQITAYL